MDFWGAAGGEERGEGWAASPTAGFCFPALAVTGSCTAEKQHGKGPSSLPISCTETSVVAAEMGLAQGFYFIFSLTGRRKKRNFFIEQFPAWFCKLQKILVLR